MIPFVSDGRARALRSSQERIAALRRRVVREVLAEHSERLRVSGPLKRMWLRMRMRREIRRSVAAEIERIAPEDGLY